MYSVKEFCNIVGLPFSTLRYYERIGLLNPEKNKINNYRRYKKEECAKVNMFRYYRSLGVDTTYAVQIVTSDDQTIDMKEIIESREKEVIQQLKTLERQKRALEQLKGNVQIKENDEIILSVDEDLLFLPCTKEEKYIELSFESAAKWSGLMPLTRHMRRIPYEELVGESDKREAAWEFGLGVYSKNCPDSLEEHMQSAVLIPGGKVLKFYLDDSTGSPLKKERMVEALNYVQENGYKIRGDIYLEGIPLNINNHIFGETVNIPVE